MPITINHPYDGDGDPASGRDPEISEKFEIGRVYSANTNGGSLRSEAWINMTLARQKLPKYDGGAEVLNKLERGEPVELSTGLFTENFPASKHATYNGKPYDYVARNYKPDHLAILLKEKGACSIDDGCGINVHNSTKYTFKSEDCPECGAELEGDPDSGTCNSCGHKWGKKVTSNADLEGGRWVTTGSGNRLYIKDGAPVAGNPHVLKATASKELRKGETAKEAVEKGDKEIPKVAKKLAKVTGTKSGPKGLGGWLKTIKSLFSGNSKRKKLESRIDNLLRRM